MNTTLSNCISEAEQEGTEVTIIRYVPREKTEGRFIRPLLKGFGLLSTLAWGAAALFPATFRIPVALQGWVFIITILWFFGYCVGLFNL